MRKKSSAMFARAKFRVEKFFTEKGKKKKPKMFFRLFFLWEVLELLPWLKIFNQKNGLRLKCYAPLFEKFLQGNFSNKKEKRAFLHHRPVGGASPRGETLKQGNVLIWPLSARLRSPLSPKGKAGEALSKWDLENKMRPSFVAVRRHLPPGEKAI